MCVKLTNDASKVCSCKFAAHCKGHPKAETVQEDFQLSLRKQVRFDSISLPRDFKQVTVNRPLNEQEGYHL